MKPVIVDGHSCPSFDTSIDAIPREWPLLKCQTPTLAMILSTTVIHNDRR